MNFKVSEATCHRHGEGCVQKWLFEQAIALFLGGFRRAFQITLLKAFLALADCILVESVRGALSTTIDTIQ